MKIYWLFFFCLVAFLKAEDWPQWRGLRSDGISLQTSILDSWPEKGLKEIWSRPLGAGYSGISVSKGIAYTIFGNNNRSYCIAIDVNTGKTLWKKELGSLFLSSWGDGPRSTPTVHLGKVYAVSSRGKMWCLHAKTGREIWKIDILARFQTTNLRHGRSASPFIYKNMLVYNVGGPGHSLLAFDKNTGKILWKSANDKAAYSTPIHIKLGEEDQLLFFTALGIVAAIPETGQVLWRYNWRTSYDVNAANPIYHQGHVFISSGYQSGAAMFKVAKQNDNYKITTVWESKKMKNHFSSSILWKGHIYGFHNAILTCMEFKTGNIKWRKRGFQKGSLVGVDGYMLILGERGILALARLNSKKYIEKARYTIFPATKCWTVPTIANGRIFIRTEKEMVCLNLTKKQ